MSDFLKKENFIRNFSKMIEAFPSLKSAPRIDRVFSFMSDLDSNAMNEVFDSIIDTFRNTPTPNDFLEATIMWKKNYRRKYGYGFGELQVIEAQYTKIDCEYCCDTGITKIKSIDLAVTHLIRCDCGAGKTNNALLPVWDNILRAGFVKEKIDPSWFNPKINVVDSEETAGGKIISKMIEWKRIVKKSEQYWLNAGYKE